MYNVWNGTAWVSQDLMLVWDGTEWKHREPAYWDGLQWSPQAIISGNYSVSTSLVWDVAAPSAPPPPPTQTYTATKTFAATWGATYRQDGGKRTDKSDLYQGYVDSFNGNQKSMCGFSVTGIPAGATCTAASVRLYANHWYNNSGGVAVIGTHNKASEPGSWSSTGTNSDRVRDTWVTKSGGRTVNLGTTIGQEFLNGTTKGIMLGPGPSTSTTYYGYFEDGGSLRPSISLTYTWVA